MVKRPFCLLCLLMMLFMCVADFAGVPLIQGNPLPVSVRAWIERHPRSVICGEVERSEDTEFSQSVYLRSTYLIYNSQKISIDNVRVFLKQKTGLPPGSLIKVKGKLIPVEGPSNPGGFDAGQYYGCRHIWYFLKEGTVTDRSLPQGGYRSFLVSLRERAGRILKETAGESAPVFSAMVLGDKSGLSPELQMKYQQAGIIHILAISGLHIGILGMGLYNLLKKAGLGIWPSAVVAVAVMIQYGIFTGSGVSTMRAVTMFLIACMAKVLGRIYDMRSALAVTAMLILLESPAYLMDTGFLLSFGCVTGLAVATEPLYCLAGVEGKAGKALVSSIAIQLVTLPVMLRAYGEVSLAGIVLNLLVLPGAGVVLGSGVASVLTGGFSIQAGKLAALPGRGLLYFYEQLCTLAGKTRLAVWIGGAPKLWQILAYYGILAGVLILGHYIGKAEKKLPGKKQKSQIRTKRYCCLAAVFFTGTAVGILGYHPAGSLKITCLDVGQGDGIVVETPDDQHILIDGGSSSRSSLARYCLMPYLKNQGISYVDMVIISHTDLDHISGTEELFTYISQGLTSIRVGSLILPGWREPPEEWKKLAELAEKAGAKVLKGNQGDVLKMGEVELDFLWPGTEAKGDEVNEEAIVMELLYRDFRMLFTGDIGSDTEKKLINAGLLEDVDCLKAGHHGSGYSSSEEFLKIIQPEISVISCSETNRYGHPSPETVSRLKKAGSRILYTMISGAVTISTDGRKIKINKQKT